MRRSKLIEAEASNVEEIKNLFPETPPSKPEEVSSAGLPDINDLLAEAGEPSRDACLAVSSETWSSIWDRPEEDEAWRNL